MAKDIFETNKELDVCYKTSDGIAFYTPHHAETHAKTLKNKKVVKHTRDEYEAKKNKSTEKERIELINSLTTVEEVTAVLKDEKNTKIKAAGEKKINELKTA